MSDLSLLSGVNRPSRLRPLTSEFDPKATSVVLDARHRRVAGRNRHSLERTELFVRCMMANASRLCKNSASAKRRRLTLHTITSKDGKAAFGRLAARAL